MSTNLGYIDGGKTSMEGLSRWMSKFITGSGVMGVSTTMKIVQAGTPDTTVKVSLGDCFIGSVAPTASNFYYHGWVSAQDSVTIAANASGNPRIDMIVAYVDKSAVSNVTADNPGVLKFMDVQGTPAGSPVAPDNTAIQAAVGASNPFITLAQVAVANGFTQIITANITDLRTFSEPYSSDAPWTAWTPVFTGFSVAPSVIARYHKIGTECKISVYTLSAGTSNSTSFSMTLPFASADIANQQTVLYYGVDNNTPVVSLANTTQNSNIMVLGNGIVGAAWTASGNKYCKMQFVYETVQV